MACESDAADSFLAEFDSLIIACKGFLENPCRPETNYSARGLPRLLITIKVFIEDARDVSVLLGKAASLKFILQCRSKNIPFLQRYVSF